MMLRIHALEPVKRYVRINLRGRNVSMSEDGLHCAQVSSILDHMRRAGVAEHVWTHVPSWRKTRSEPRLSDQLPDALTGQAAASRAEEQKRRTSFFSQYFSAAFQVSL